ncbi:MAG TPA: glycerol-3-phosphate transporter, partial [Ramlibacter sp.]|nr:glycerol-3-phosphate transporter [Ramlibacter sp.]
MVERRPTLGLLAHAVQIIGVLIIVFPIYLAFIASTHSAAEIASSRPLSLLPGSHFVETYRLAL